jgi:hypothetical protein
MRQIRYNHATNVLRMEFPPEWDGKLISGVTVGIKDREATELLAAQSVTLYTATTVDGDVDRYANTIVLDSGAGSLSIGDPLLLCGAAGDEVVRVKDYDSTTYTVTLETILQNEYADNSPVYGLFGSYTLDVTDTDTYTTGLVLVLTWTPTGDGSPTTELAQIAVSELELVGIELAFNRIYQRAYDAFKRPVDIFDDMVEEATRQVRYELLASQLDIHRVKDQGVITPLVMAKMAYLWSLNADEDKTDERVVINAEYDRQLGIVKALPLWVDTDQDEVEEEDEVSDHGWMPNRGW